ncbi:MAG: cytochrome C [Acidobacteria bacterium]|nr:cytochrome C [Acidobacteriota bacterium]
MDWHQIWENATKPDNIPIAAMLFLVPFYTWYGLRQAFHTDRLIAELEADPQKAKTHHRKIFPFKPGWEREVHTWPYLMRIEFLAAVIVTIILMIWSITLNAPLEEPANPNLTPNESRAPWYFVGLQEMLVYFDPWIAGVLMPTLIIIGLMVIPYIDTNPLGNGYYTFRQRRIAILGFCFGFLVLWVGMVMVGTFIRGPGWIWFWPGETWDHNALVFEVNRDLPDLVGITSTPGKFIFGGLVVGLYYLATGYALHRLMSITEFHRKIYRRLSLLQYLTIQAFAITMIGLPVKMLLRHLPRAFGLPAIKYIWVTPWFNV